jgi:hypothetical protein
MKATLTLFLTALCAFVAQLAVAQSPTIPAGYDAYRMWTHWPDQRIGERAYMRATYDHSGGNDDPSEFLYQLAPDKNVTLDVQGPGILYFARYNHWHGSPWHYEVDGRDSIVAESGTSDPLHPPEHSTFLPKDVFREPLAFTWSTTQGADLSWIPVGFERSFRMAYSRTFYGTGYYIYDQFVEGTPLSQPIRSWDGKTPPPQDVLDLISRAGEDIAPPPGQNGVQQQSGKIDLQSAVFTPIWHKSGAGEIRAIEFSLPKEQAVAFSRARLRIFWDGRKDASVDAPFALFYGAGTLYNRDNKTYLVKSFPMVIRYDSTRVYLSCYFPMPFFHSARVEVAGLPGQLFTDLRWHIRYGPFHGATNSVGYFHATYRDHPKPELGKDLVLLDTRKTESNGDWSGQFVGTSFIFSHDAILGTLEGDPRFFFDDSLTPQAQGTGTEEWGGGGDYWGGLNMTLPFAGHPVGAESPEKAVNAEDKIESAYRFLLADMMPFGKNALIGLEHGATNDFLEHYETVTYWYGIPAPSLVESDTLQIGDAASEKAHDYSSPDASAPYQIESRYEWGVDHLNGKEIYPASRDRGRTTHSGSEFTLKTDPDNLGVMLRRKLDYSFPNQRAEIYIADEKSQAWKLAGIWYTAGSNTCVRSSPKDELGATVHELRTSNRRFRDDEFLVPRRLTQGRASIRVRVKFTPVKIPFYPGAAFPDLEWSEIHYSAYSFVSPNFH